MADPQTPPANPPAPPTPPANPPAPPAPPAPKDKKPSRDDVRMHLSKHKGNVHAAIADLMDRLVHYRGYRKIEKGQATVDDIKAIIPQGFTVITAAEGTELATYRAFGKPDEVKTKIENAVKLDKELAESKRKELHAEAAASVQWNPKAFAKLAAAENLHIELREETVDGKPVKRAFARKADEANATLTPLSEYAEKNLPEFLPALQKLDEQEPNPQKGVRVPAQRGSAPKPSDKTDYVAPVIGRYMTPGQLAAAQKQ